MGSEMCIRDSLSTLHFHDEKITANTNQLAMAMNRLNLQAGKATRMIEILNFKAKIDLMMAQVDQQTDKAIAETAESVKILYQGQI